MSAHVLVILLNKLGKRDKMQDLQSILSLLQRAQMLANVRFYLSYDIKIILKSYIWRETIGFCHMPDIKSVIS